MENTIDRWEKVIKGLECCDDYCDEETGCPYYDELEPFDCQEQLRADAIVLLKEDERAIKFQSDRLDALLKTQEPVDVDEWPDEFLCPTCKTRLARRSHDDCVLLDTNDTPNFCWVCGQAVKWE